MERKYLLKALVLLVLAVFTTAHLQAQQPTGERTLAVHIEGLTAETRDAIAADLAQAGEFRVAYACVPAGILVIEPKPDSPLRQHPGTGEEMRSRITSMVTARIPSTDMRTEQATMAELEARCAAFRDQ